MRDYGRIHTAIWGSQDFVSFSDDARLLALYLLTSPHTTMIGAFRLPDGYVCADIGWSIERVSKGFDELFRKGFCNRCETTNWMWVVKFLRWNPPENPNQWKAARKQSRQIPERCSWKQGFMKTLDDAEGGLSRKGYERVTKPGTGTGTGSKEDVPPDKPVAPPAYPADFESIWQAYPKRDGSNPKKPAYGAYRQRLKEGAPHDDIAAGVQRYAAWCDATGKTGLETVMQAKRFFGPGREWENPWTTEAAVTLPKDAHELWDIRKRLELPPFFDDVKSCHAEIRAKLRDHPELRAVL